MVSQLTAYRANARLLSGFEGSRPGGPEAKAIADTTVAPSRDGATDTIGVTVTSPLHNQRWSRVNLIAAAAALLVLVAAGIAALVSRPGGDDVTARFATSASPSVETSATNATPTGSGTATPQPPSAPPRTPTSGASRSATPPVTGFPSAATTGVPTGTSLTASGSVTVTVAGTVIDAKQITGDITIKAANVLIKRSRISAGDGLYPIRVTSGSVTVEDTEITGGRSAAVCCGDFTLRRVNIHHVNEGPRMSSNSVIENSYIHHLVRCADCHVDALQSTGGTNITIRGNNIQAYNPDLNDPMNAAFQFGEEQAVLRNCLIEGNLLNGGNYTLNGGGGGTTGAQCTIRNNKFQRDFRYGAAGNIHGAVAWAATNVWQDTGQPVR